MAAYNHINQPFRLPSGFNPQGTQIALCLDQEMGYFDPTDDIEYSFLLKYGDYPFLRYHHRRDTPKNTEIHLMNNKSWSLEFVSPIVSQPDGSLYSGEEFKKLMITSWEKFVSEKKSIVWGPIGRSFSQPSGEVGAKGTPETCDGPKGFDGDINAVTLTFKVHGQKIIVQNYDNVDIREPTFIVIEGELYGVIFTYVKGVLTVVGYQTYQSTLPKDIYRILYLHYPTIRLNNFIPYEVKSPNFEYKRYKDNTEVFTQEPVEGVVFRRENGKKIVLGKGPYHEPLERDIALYIVLNYHVDNFVVSEDVVKQGYLETEPYLPNDETLERPIPNCVVTAGALIGLLLRKERCFYYMVDPDDGSLSGETYALIRERYPMIVRY